MVLHAPHIHVTSRLSIEVNGPTEITTAPYKHVTSSLYIHVNGPTKTTIAPPGSSMAPHCGRPERNGQVMGGKRIRASLGLPPPPPPPLLPHQSRSPPASVAEITPIDSVIISWYVFFTRPETSLASFRSWHTLGEISGWLSLLHVSSQCRHFRK